MSDLDLAAIKARCAAATREPWRLSSSEGIICGDDMYLIDGGGIAPSDAEFIAAARTDVPALVAEVERLRESAHHQLKDAEETHRMQLAAISCAAYANTVDGIAARLTRDNPYWTDSYDTVCASVDREVRERTRAETAEAEVARLTAQKDNAYNERDRCVSVIACLARALGWPVWLGTHEGDPWDEEWRNIVFIETPHGQVSWHYHDSERPMFSWIGLGMPMPKPWDGHSTPEKYNLLFGLVHDGIPNVQAEVERLREERDDQASLVEVFEDEAKRLRSDLAECYRITGADPDGDDDAMLARKAVAAVKRLREESDTEAETADKRIAELEIGVREIAIMHQDDRPGIGEPSGDFDWRLRSEAQERVARVLLAKGGAA